MQSRRVWMYLVVALVFFVGSAAMTYWLLYSGEPPFIGSLPQDNQEELTKTPTSDKGNTDSNGQPLPVRLEAGAVLIRLFDGNDGELHTLPSEKVPDTLLGKSKDEILEENPQWSVLDISPKRLTVRVELAEAALATGTRYLGVYNDKLAIFRGSPGVVGQLEEVTDIPVKLLPEYEQENLRKGQVFTEEELGMLLESLSEAAESRRQGE